MKYFLMCEGKNEETLIELLLDNNKLRITRDDLIGRKSFNVRNIKNPFIKSELKRYNKEVIIYRIGDKQNDKLSIPNDLKYIIKENNIYKYCTKPEMEILLIINEGLISSFNKSKKTPKTFAKENIKFNKERYNQSSEFLREYYGGKRVDLLVKNLKEYKKFKNHAKDELYLADLLK